VFKFVVFTFLGALHLWSSSGRKRAQAVVVISLQTEGAEGGGAGRCGRERELAHVLARRWRISNLKNYEKSGKVSSWEFWCQDSNSGARIQILVKFATMWEAPSKDLYPFCKTATAGRRERERRERARARERERTERQTDRQTDRQRPGIGRAKGASERAASDVLGCKLSRKERLLCAHT
jgi:hypothetical protein